MIRSFCETKLTKLTTTSKTGLIPLTRRTSRTEPILDGMEVKSIIKGSLLLFLPFLRVDRGRRLCMFASIFTQLWSSAGMGMKDKQPDEDSAISVLDGSDESNPRVLTSESSKTDAIGFSLVEALCASQR
jgi:hypothetical protein